MVANKLKILNTGSYLPQSARSVKDLIRDCGGQLDDYSNWSGWSKVFVTEKDERPSQMAAKALEIALEKAMISSDQLSLLISTGGSREYLPPFCVAADVMNEVKAGSNCLGMDLLAGCVSGLASINIVESWLNTYGGKYAAIVSSENWSQSIDFANPENRSLRGFSDGATAMVVTVDPSAKALATFQGACFASQAKQSRTLVGETVQNESSQASDVLPYAMKLADPRKAGAWEAYKTCYTKVIGDIFALTNMSADWLICNQTSPSMIDVLSEISGVPKERAIITGHDFGHVGNGDIVLALEKLTPSERPGNLLVASSAPYSWGAGIFT